MTAKGNNISIRLNTVVDIWEGEVRERGDSTLQGEETTQFFYKESQIMVQLDDSRFIYGSIARTAREKISK